MTLTELLVASLLGLVVILAIGQLDVTRLLLTKGGTTQAGSQAELSFALAHMVKRLQQADRIMLITTGPPDANVQLRIPQDITKLDDNAGYRWVQYRRIGGDQTIRFYDPTSPCTVALVFREINSLSVKYKDESPPPPGGDPPVQDNNVLELTLSSTSGTTLTSEVTIRAGAYTNVNATAAGDSGSGLAPPGIADPPTPCL